MKRAICWIRRDIRINDNRALFNATQASEGVATVFIFDTNILQDLQDSDDKRVTFIHESLVEMQEKLQKQGSDLLVRIGDPIIEIPKLARELEVDGVFASHDFEPYALERDRRIKTDLAEIGVIFKTSKDHVVRQKTEILNQSGLPFKVFTPYSNAWNKSFSASAHVADFESRMDRFLPKKVLAPHVQPWSLADIGFTKSTLWLKSGEDAALKKLDDFCRIMDRYRENRNRPCLNGTSGLSVHLRFGTVSVRECVRRALQRQCEGSKVWLSELIWRDFYADILAHNPKVIDNTYKPIYRDLVWPGTDEHYQAWENGMTGYPIVDAAMRCLNKTGWMHNRLRMIVASFLTKDLLVDYRKGESHFARKLLDFDLASNNGGWQWAASTGCDSQPYFRVFNPYLQSEKYDVDGKFIKEWLPELSHLGRDSIHMPGKDDLLGTGYPLPIVQHDVMRPQAIKLLSVPSVK